MGMEIEKKFIPTDLPKDLYKAIQFASDVGCQTLCLDCDGTVVGFLDKYDW